MMDAMEFDDEEVLIIYEKQPVAMDIEILPEKLLQDNFDPLKLGPQVEAPMMIDCDGEKRQQDEPTDQFTSIFTENVEPELAFPVSTTVDSPTLPQNPVAESYPSFEAVFTEKFETQLDIPTSTSRGSDSLPQNPLDSLPGQNLSEVKLEDLKVHSENSDVTLNMESTKPTASFLQLNSKLLKPQTTTSVIQVKKCYFKTIPKPKIIKKNLTRKPQAARAQFFDKSKATSIFERTSYIKLKELKIPLQKIEEWYNGPYTLPPYALEILNFKCYEKNENKIKISCVTSLSDEILKPNECEYCLRKLTSSFDHEQHPSDYFSNEIINLKHESDIVSSTSCDEQVVTLNAEQLDFLQNLSDTDLENNGPLKVFYCKRCQSPFGSFNDLLQHYQKFHIERLHKIIQTHNLDHLLRPTQEIHDILVASPETQEVLPKQEILESACSNEIVLKPAVHCEPCPICFFQVYSRSHLEIHMKEHWKKKDVKSEVGCYPKAETKDKRELWYLCEFCQLIFDKEYLLSEHVQLHEAEGPIYNKKKLLRRHMCTICSKVYRGLHSFNSHVVNCHLAILGCVLPEKTVYVYQDLSETSLGACLPYNNQPAKFSCKVCGLKLNTKKKAMNHMLSVHCDAC